MRDVLTIPNPKVRQKCKPVKRINLSTAALIRDMKAVVERRGALGLAANQLGVPLRVIVVRLKANDLGLVALINPAFGKLPHTDLVSEEEGCLSCPGERVSVVRYTHIVVTGQKSSGAPCRLELEGMDARVVQHEIDHLDGILIVDHKVEEKAA